jgi:hypothetical protein
MKLKFLSQVVLALSMALASACGGGSGGSGASGVSGSKTLASLTTSEKQQLCDWTAAESGGYGKTVTCADGSDSSNDANQAACVAAVPTCSVTVAQFEACTKVVVTVPLCEQDAKFLEAPECQPVVACAK